MPKIERLAISYICLSKVCSFVCFHSMTTDRLQSKSFSNVLLHSLPTERNLESILDIFLISKLKS